MQPPSELQPNGGEEGQGSWWSSVGSLDTPGRVGTRLADVHCAWNGDDYCDGGCVYDGPPTHPPGPPSTPQSTQRRPLNLGFDVTRKPLLRLAGHFTSHLQSSLDS